MENLPLAAVKIIGALSGAVLALIYDQPKSWGGFWRRLSFAAIVSFLLTDTVREHLLHWPENATLATSVVVALVSWSAWSMALRIMSVWKPKE
jgi:hypothetical protein